MTDSIDPGDLTEKGKRKLDLVRAMRQLADDAYTADSIADDAPALSELFHEVRTSRRRSRDGRHVALLDYDHDAGSWSCRSVAFLETGTHYRNTGADLVLSHKPRPLMSVDKFCEYLSADIERSARATEQNAWNYRKDDPRP